MKPKPDIEQVLQRIIAGESYRTIADAYDMPLSTLFDWLHKDEHSARVREAMEYSADTIADKGEECLLNAKSTLVEVTRARELSQFYKWKASKRSPKKYGDKIEVDATHTIKDFKVEILTTGTPLANSEEEIKE